MPKVRLQNQEFPIDDALIALDPKIVAEQGEEEAKKQRDSNLKRWLSTVSPAATNATLSWTEESKPDGTKETIIRVTPQLGTKGGRVSEALIERLGALPQRVHPVIALAFELRVLEMSGQFTGREALTRLLSYQERIELALDSRNNDQLTVSGIAQELRHARPIPSPWIPPGF